LIAADTQGATLAARPEATASSPGPVARWIGLAALTLLYFLAGKLGLSLAFVHASATAVWPPTGIALAAFLIGGYGVWPAILLGAFLVNVTTAGSAATSLGIAVGNTLEGVVGAYLVNSFAGGRHAFQRPRDVFRFAALAAILSTTVSASCGLASLSLGGLAAWDGAIWLTWWLGDAVGALVVAPVLILWSVDRHWRWRGARLLELAILLLTLGLAGLAVFTHAFHGGNYPLQVLTIPMLLWAAFRFGQREAATSVLLLSVIAIWGTLRGAGPFARESQNESLLMLQAFMGVWAVSVLALAAVVGELRAAERKVRLLNEELEWRVRDRTSQLEQANQTLTREAEARRLAQEQLQQSATRLLEAQQVGHIGSWEWNIERNLVSWSEELYRIYGLDPGSFAASYEGFLERVHPEDRARVDEAVRRSLEDRQPFGFEHRLLRPDGSIRTLSARGRVVLDGEGKPVRMLGTGQDITDLKTAEEERAQLISAQAARREAEEASRLKDEFLATLSHELRTPLNAIVGWGYVLKEAGLEGPDAAKAIGAIGRNAKVLTRLIADLLDISRAMGGRLSLDLRPTDARAVIRAAAEAVRPEADAKSVRIQLGLDARSPLVQADPGRLEQVVWNLLSNAIKFSPEGGSVRVRLARVEGQQLEIAVEDDGPGIAPDFLPHLFERFRQADGSTTRRHGGLGLGLAIVRNLVELHGGTVFASNRSDAPGAVFRVRLACLDSAGEAVAGLEPAGGVDEQAAPWRAAAASLRGLRLLVVDDEPDGREAIAGLLERCGMEVMTAGSAAEGLAVLERRRPHVVLSDIQMPGEDGYVFLRKLRELPPERGGLTPVAALTAYAGSEERARALAAGFQLHVAKPVDPGELVKALAGLLPT
jgi:PAS domain S-box-containing protein